MSTDPSYVEPPVRLSVIRKKARAAEVAAQAALQAGTLPPRVDLTLYQGDDFFLDLLFSSSTGGVDLTTYTPKAEIRASAGDPQLITSFVATVTNATTIRLHLTHASAEMLGTDAVWDCQVTDSSGLVTTVAYGNIALTRQVTR